MGFKAWLVLSIGNSELRPPLIHRVVFGQTLNVALFLLQSGAERSGSEALGEILRLAAIRSDAREWKDAVASPVVSCQRGSALLGTPSSPRQR